MTFAPGDTSSHIPPEKDAAPSVMFVLHSLGAGGSERVVTTIANVWAGEGRNVSIVTFDGRDTPPFYPLAENVRLFNLGLPAVSKPLWRALKRTNERITALRKTFADHKPDVVISFLTKTNIMTLEAAKSLNTPVIISERNNPNAQQFNRMWRTARARTYPRAFAFVTMTRGAAEYYPERQRPRTTIIPNPINLPEDWRNQRGGKILTAVGRLTEQKRFDVLIDAFAEIADDFPDWTLTIWGEGEDRAKLEAQRDALGLSERIKMPGLTPKPGAWIETADVFALSSDYEGWANVILEAMAAGLPIVSTDCPYSPGDLLDHGRSGMLVPTGDAHAFAGALSEVLADQTLRGRLGDNAREASRQYRTEKIVAQWDALVNAANAEQRER